MKIFYFIDTIFEEKKIFFCILPSVTENIIKNKTINLNVNDFAFKNSIILYVIDQILIKILLLNYFYF
jgi:hypothetical protein